jgi:hypothetical protein
MALFHMSRNLFVALLLGIEGLLRFLNSGAIPASRLGSDSNWIKMDITMLETALKPITMLGNDFDYAS